MRQPSAGNRASSSSARLINCTQYVYVISSDHIPPQISPSHLEPTIYLRSFVTHRFAADGRSRRPRWHAVSERHFHFRNCYPGKLSIGSTSMYADGCVELLILLDSVLGFFKTSIFHPNVFYGDGDPTPHEKHDDGSFTQEQIGLGNKWEREQITASVHANKPRTCFRFRLTIRI